MAAADELGIVPAGFAVLHTPLLPFAAFAEWGAGLAAAGADGDALADALDRDRAVLAARLRACFADPAAREAIALGGPRGGGGAAPWARDLDVESNEAVVELARALARMAAVAEPAGPFAGISTIRLARATNLRVAPRAEWRRRTRLDAAYLGALAERLAAAPALRAAITHVPNGTLYGAAGKLRYVEARPAAAGERACDLASVGPSPELDAVVARAAAGATVAELAAEIAGDDVALDEATAYVESLIEAQVIVPDLAPPLTGDDPVATLSAELSAIAPGRAASRRLDAARRAIDAADASSLAADGATYAAIAGSLEDAPAPIDPARVVHVDLLKPAPEATLGPAVLDELARAAALWARIGRTRRWHDALAPFREAFVARYGERRIPLLEALDDDAGVGFGDGGGASPALAGLAFPPGDGPKERARTAREKRRDGHVLRLFEDARARGALEIALTDDDVAALEGERPRPLPDVFHVTATIAARSSRAVDDGDFRVFVRSLTGPSGGAIAGRFARDDAALRAALAALVRDEEALAPDVVFAEIVHAPHPRLGNVAGRPVLRAHEIPLVDRSGAPRDRRIPLADLLVSVRGGDGGRVELHSAKDGREIRPCLTAARAFDGADVGVYRFLCAAAGQPPDARLWDWDQLMRAAFLPRVTAGRLVLSLAQWRIDGAEIQGLRAARGAARYAAARALRARRGMPRFVALADGDALLPIDLDNVVGVDAFAGALASCDEAHVCELFPDGEHVFADDGPGDGGPRRFAHEIVVPFVRAARREEREEGRAGGSGGAVPRSFAPGTEWLLAKIYAGPAAADDVLRGVVRPLVDAHTSGAGAREWFFTRAGDPERHVRLLVRGAPESLVGRVLPAIESATRPWRASSRGAPPVSRLAFDTYERDVERFGGPAAIEAVERIFCADSEAALALVEALAGEGVAAGARWLMALLGVDRLLDDLGLPRAAKAATARATRADLAHEVGEDARLAGQLDATYARDRARLEAVLRGDATDIGDAYAILDARSQRLRPAIAELGGAASRGPLAASLARAHANRVLRAPAPAEELVLYDRIARLHAPG